MAKESRKEFILAQNFLKRANLVRALIEASTIGPADLVYEIGAGRGIITAELARIARKVIALEIDPVLVRFLRGRFQDVSNVEIFECDFLRYRIAAAEYKIFANIPYNRTAEIVRKILETVPAPQKACLVMQKEAAEKFSGRPKETRFSIMAKPWFTMKITRDLHRRDFDPLSGVDSVLLCIRKRSPPLLPKKDGARYRRFVSFGFGGWKRSLKTTFRRIFSHRRWKRLSAGLCFPLHATPTELTFPQWFGLFEDFSRRAPDQKQTAFRKRGESFLGAEVDFQRPAGGEFLKGACEFRQRQGVADQRRDLHDAIGQPRDRRLKGEAQGETPDDG